MKPSRNSFRRLILGLSIEDAQSKFDSSESRNVLRVAHERFNHGIYHELQIAQRQRNGLSPDRKCHITRFAKPSVRGFQAYMKESPDDYIIREIWEEHVEEESSVTDASLSEKSSELSSSFAVGSPLKLSKAGIPAALSSKIVNEQEQFKTLKTIVLNTLNSALQLVIENVHSELSERRQNGSLLSANHQSSVMDRLAGELEESQIKGYKSLSSSSHLLEPVEMEVALFGKKDKKEIEAFRSPVLSVPVREGNVSYSLWLAGGLIANQKLADEFPFHTAKHIVSGKKKESPGQLPQAEVDVYFSPELFQLFRTIGKSGVTMLRQFIGTAMMKQHEPTPVSSSLLLNAADEKERQLYSIYNPTVASEEIRIPWTRKTVTKVSTVTGVIFSTEDSSENPSTERMRDSILQVWRAWGQLIKDLHVHGDSDFLYISINRNQELQGNNEYIAELREIEAGKRRENLIESPTTTTALLSYVPPSSKLVESSPGRNKLRKFYIPLSADFVVIECTLERKGLPHNMVMEDITSTLSDMQREHLEISRLSLVDAAENTALDSKEHTASSSQISSQSLLSSIVPVLYEPKIVVSHAGVIENGVHSFQKIRIRGSNRAHVEALAAALQDDNNSHFTSRTVPLQASIDGTDGVSSTKLPPNLSFHAKRNASQSPNNTRLLGHRAPPSSALSRDGATAFGGRYARHQVISTSDAYATVTDDERQFWKEHYYRLSDIQVMFHDRVDAEDALGKALHTLPPRLVEHLSLLNRRLDDASPDGAASQKTIENVNEESSSKGRLSAGRKGKKRKKRNSKGKSTAETAAPTAAVAEAKRALLPPEKLFEYLCTDMEAETTLYDLRVGDCRHYDYTILLRRIPDKEVSHAPIAFQSIASKGFINYFGPQRFASYTKMNMHPGLHLLKGEFKAAAHILVQQFYLDAALEAERRRTGQAFPRILSMQGFGGYHLPDFRKSAGRRSVAEHGSAMQRVLHNALQASSLLVGEGDTAEKEVYDQGQKGINGVSAAALGSSLGSPLSSLDDPCAEAFIRVIGPRACGILVQEFLCFIWNDIVNQRIQRYGTYSLLPGDLVLPRPTSAASSSASMREAASPVHVSRREIEQGERSVWDLVLPIPGVGMQLPDNYTTDLYVVTLKRYGLHFNPEARQWGCFMPAPIESSSSMSASTRSPYYGLTSSFALMEEELGYATPVRDPLVGQPQVELESEKVDAVALRGDLRHQHGNPLGLVIAASYRHPLVQPTGELMQWKLHRGLSGDPYQRWGHALTSQHRCFPQLGGNNQEVIAATPSPSLPVAEGNGGCSSAIDVTALFPGLMVGFETEGKAGSLRNPTSLPGDVTVSAPQGSLSRYGSPNRWSGRPQTSGKKKATSAGCPAPSWLPRNHGSVAEIHLRLPSGIYPSMLLREVMKMDVNTPDIVDLDRTTTDRRAHSWNSLTSDQQSTYQRYLAKRRRQREFLQQPRAISLALLHQQIFRSNGVRHSLLPTLRSYDSVSK